eukprot:CAMPEP_0173438316 /NCGR_PEP_ID=MMETSP1357-20121228/20027_1 /TAXON_ID=77926 /ORGANISM="Hemiselmis rufescens, Strain PCC563" /LENGTH=189 /DNA_ID=CAMNT_0014403603 /DNA_START=82 /DNA_END=651 /DNA_ORIENTATION=+
MYREQCCDLPQVFRSDSATIDTNHRSTTGGSLDAASIVPLKLNVSRKCSFPSSDRHVAAARHCQATPATSHMSRRCSLVQAEAEQADAWAHEWLLSQRQESMHTDQDGEAGGKRRERAAGEDVRSLSDEVWVGLRRLGRNYKSLDMHDISSVAHVNIKQEKVIQLQDPDGNKWEVLVAPRLGMQGDDTG